MNHIVCISDPIKRRKVLKGIEGRYTRLKALDEDHLAKLIQQKKPKAFICEMVQHPKDPFELIAWQLEFQAKIYADPVALRLAPAFSPDRKESEAEGSAASDH